MNIEATMDWVAPCGDDWSEELPNTFLRDCDTGTQVRRGGMHVDRASRSNIRPYFRAEGDCAKPTEENPERFVWAVFDKQPAQAIKATVINKKVSIAERFTIMSQKWKEEVAAESSLSKITGNINYLTVIGLGAGAVPAILSDLQKTGAPWFIALEAITGLTGMGTEYPGNFRKKRELWLQWGREQGHI